MNRHPTHPATSKAAGGTRTERAVRFVGHWSPELLGAAFASAAAHWVWSGWWVVAGMLLASIPFRPLVYRWRAYYAKKWPHRVQITHTQTADRTHDRTSTDTDWEASA